MGYLIKPTSPCKKDCPYRNAYCRADCIDFAEYQEKYKQYYEAKCKKREADSEFYQYKKNIIQKANRKRR